MGKLIRYKFTSSFQWSVISTTNWHKNFYFQRLCEWREILLEEDTLKDDHSF